jgi:dihydrofolate reductase
MRKIIVTEFITLDGVVDEPHTWSFPYWNDDLTKFKSDELFAGDAMLLGRVTYDAFASSWPTRTNDAFADRINSMPKYVVSTTLKKADWQNTTVLGRTFAEDLRTLRAQPGGDIYVHGSPALVQSLIVHDLVDQYNLLVFPIVLGEGKRLFADGTTTKLKLSKVSQMGAVVALIHEPAPPARS